MDLYDKILIKYSIDITQENIFKLYKIDNPDISEQEMQETFEATRKRWNQSINGANEKNAERDRVRLEKAEKYEEILKDKKLRKELFRFYNTSSEIGFNNKGAGSSKSINTAKEYFELIATTKTITKRDVEFYFEYYPEQRKTKKAILEMLAKDLKVKGLGKESNYVDDDELEGKKKKETSPLIVNLFQEATIIKLKKSQGFYESAKASQEIQQRFSNIKENLYNFLEMQDIDSAKVFSNIISEKAREAYAIRQEKGAEYIPLVDLFNTLQSIAEYQDIVDNFDEFKLLVKYPNLTPYMYAFANMKSKTLDELLKIAKIEYAFRDKTDFLLNYFIPIHDNFNISASGIRADIKKAEKKAKENEILNKIDEKLGWKKKRKISIVAEIVHWLVYLPIFAMYFIFEIFKKIFTNLSKMVIPIFIIVFISENILFPQLFEVENLLEIGKILNRNQWYSSLSLFAGVSIGSALEAILMSIIYILALLMIYILPALLVSRFVYCFTEDLNKRYDWIGYERTFQNIFQNIRERTENQFVKSKKLFYKDKTKKLIINIFCTVLIIVLIYLAPKAFATFSETTGYFQKNMINQEEKYQEEEITSLERMGQVIITVETANVRAGASTEHEVVDVVSKGTVLEMTGNQQVASNGSTWYEVYLDTEKTKIGWASEKVLEVQK